MRPIKSADEYIGEKFGRMSIVSDEGLKGDKSGKRRRMLLCACDCGREKEVRMEDVVNGRTTSCGCSRGSHGKSNTREYGIWAGMIGRCSNKNIASFKDYGAKGIMVCGKWRAFSGFWEDMMSGYADNLTIDRIDSDGDYEPGNCRWATMLEQQNNKTNNKKITLNGETMNISQWTRKMGLPPGTVWNRIYIGGWSPERAINTPPKQANC
jgi:hypothetical protein